MVRADSEDQLRSRPRRDSRAQDHVCRRLRHISSIQICNFTPFPIRDTVTSALALPSQQAPQSANGHFLDDIELARSKRRSRRVSAASVATLKDIQDEQGHADGAPQGRRRTLSGAGERSYSRTDIGRVASNLSPAEQHDGEGAGPASLPPAPLKPPAPFTPGFSSFWLHSSQTNLEKVLQSRLVETMVGLVDTSGEGSAQNRPSSSVPSPSFLSEIHPPSTNPAFTVGTHNCSSWTNSSMACVTLSVFGRLQHDERPPTSSKGKEKARELPERASGGEWVLLQSWAFDLNDLVAVPDDQTTTTLPFNCPVLTFGLSPRKYYLRTGSLSWTQTEGTGHQSDTESDPRTAVNGPPSTSPQSSPKRATAERKSRAEVDEPMTPSQRRRGNTTSATWQDLIKLGTLQTCIADTNHSLDELMANIYNDALADGVSTLYRHVSEQEYTVQSRHSDIEDVLHQSAELRDQIANRKEDLKRRRSLLAAAAADEAANAQAQVHTYHRITRDRSDLHILQSQLLPTRKNLVTTLSYIFPIDLASPADLLFTIVSVPLPIPVAATDPAPPLSLPQHRDVNEDSVATSLGYAALVIQLVAAYLGHRLVYPVTYVGSRSVIKDDISAMVGPRMFPLYSKGVDTYRFEYGVFLLNKNIEMLMAERDLRALDIRHTLPNLKNLLLTLTNSDGLCTTQLHHKLSSHSILSLRTSSPTPSTSTISSASQDTAPTDLTDTSAGSAEGSPSTPSTPTLDAGTLSRKSKGYFGLSPLSGFLRGRYPSSVSAKPSVKAVAEAGEEDNTTPTASVLHATGEGDDDADRVTIRGVAGVNNAAEVKSSEYRSRASGANGRAKELIITVTPSSPAPPIVS